VPGPELERKPTPVTVPSICILLVAEITGARPFGYINKPAGQENNVESISVATAVVFSTRTFPLKIKLSKKVPVTVVESDINILEVFLRNSSL
jgi:hypothetical protein